MKRCILLMTAFMGLTALSSQAQTATQPVSKQQRQMPTPEEQAQRQTEKATRDLTLTTDQQGKFKAFALERINTVQPLREKMKNTTDKAERQKIHGDIKAAGDKFESNVKGILTPEQQTKWEAQKQSRMDKAKERQSERRENQDSKQ